MAYIFKACSVDGCNGNAHYSAKGSKGYCNPHYKRLWRHGDPLGGSTSPGDPLRFIHEVAAHHKGSECLEWPFGKGDTGYGVVWVEGKLVGAHRYVCKLAHGEPPTPKHDAAHSCGKGHEGCIAPEHLSWKTRTENKDDELLHGTRNRGERQGIAKLTEAEAREILALKGIEKNRYLAERFSVSPSAISDIHAGRNWAWLSEITSLSQR